jgi:paraquat-inducible protein A
MTRLRAWWVAWLLGGSAVLLGLGLVGPCMTLLPSAGDLDVWVRVFQPDDLTPQTYSILTGLRAMWDHGNPGIAALLLAFSVVFPTLKLAAMAWGTAALTLGVRPHLAIRLTHHLGKFSMLDVMVIGLLVLAVKGLPGETRLTLDWGIWAFAASVGLGLVVTLLLHGVRPRRV